METKEENQYKTHNIAEAAALILKKQKFLKIDKEKTGRCWFVFENKQKCEELSHQFFFGYMTGNLIEYHEILTLLKSKLFS